MTTIQAVLVLLIVTVILGTVAGVVLLTVDLTERGLARRARHVASAESPVYVPPRDRPTLQIKQPVLKHWCPECDCTTHTVMVWTTFSRYICRECLDNGGHAHKGSVAWKREQLIAAGADS